MSAFYCLFQSNIFKLKNLKIFEKIEIDEKSKVSKSFDLILWYNLGINIQYKYHVFEFKNFTQVNKIGKLNFFCFKKPLFIMDFLFFYTFQKKELKNIHEYDVYIT